MCLAGPGIRRETRGGVTAAMPEVLSITTKICEPLPLKTEPSNAHENSLLSEKRRWQAFTYLLSCCARCRWDPEYSTATSLPSSMTETGATLV